MANGLFSAPGYGNATFTVAHVAYGVESVFQRTESRTERTIYFRNTTNDNFTVTLLFNSWDTYTAAANWFRGYMEQAADPEVTGVSPMIVNVPLRNFTGVGIPEGGISFGDRVGEIVYEMNITFTGASDYSQATEISYTPPINNLPTNAGNRYFYPLAVQLATPYESVDAQIYDAPKPPNSIGRGITRPHS